MSDQECKPTPENTTLFQALEWNVPADGKHYQRILSALPGLKSIGIDNVLLPPGCKASSPSSNGYDIYDLYDLGAFEQKGSRSTKFGSVEELMQLSDKAQEIGVGLYWDAVLNHKAGADHKEKCKAVEVDKEDRNKEIAKPEEIEAWLGFDFAGRGDKYSAQKYHWYHFSGTGYNAKKSKKAIYKIDGKVWDSNVDYLMFEDLDYSNDEVVNDVKNWGVWIVKELKLKGFRLDAVRHFKERFTGDWVNHIRKACGADIFFVGEFFTAETKTLGEWLEKIDREVSLYDVPLMYNFSKVSRTKQADLRKVFHGSLVQAEPANAVTFVMSHDTQPGQTCATPIESFFKTLAYALILLRRDGYPSVFYGDLYGLLGNGDDAPPEPPACNGKLPDLVLARKLYAYGEQDDHFDEPNCIGWVRRGTSDKPFGLACVMSNSKEGQKKMCVGVSHKGEVWTDLLEKNAAEVQIDKDGYGVFPCSRLSVSIWVSRDAEGRDRFPVQFDSDIYKQKESK